MPNSFKSLSSDLKKEIKSILSMEIGAPILTLGAIVDLIFENEEWWNYEHETLLSELDRLGYPEPNINILGQIQALSAIRGSKSLIDKEWHLFEKAALAFTGIPVIFYEKQDLPIEVIYHALKNMRKVGTVELSEEVKHYIGCEAISSDILWHPIEEIDGYIKFAISNLGTTLLSNTEEIKSLRRNTEDQFNSWKEMDLETISPDMEDPSHIMCLSIFKSLLLGQEISNMESTALNNFEAIKEGRAVFVEDKVSELPAESVIDNSEEDTDVDPFYDPEIELNTDENTLIESFEDGVKQGIEEKAAQLKEAQIEGVPIPTGVPMGGLEEDDKTELSHQYRGAETAESTADEINRDRLNETLPEQQYNNNIESGDTYKPSTEEHEVINSASVFDL